MALQMLLVPGTEEGAACHPLLFPAIPCPHDAFAQGCIPASLRPGTGLLWRAAWSRDLSAGLNHVL